MKQEFFEYALNRYHFFPGAEHRIKTILLERFGFCWECDGTGYIEVQKQCGVPMSQCCGGCMEDVECNFCK